MILIKHKSVYNFKNTLLVKKKSLFLLWWAKAFFFFHALGKFGNQ